MVVNKGTRPPKRLLKSRTADDDKVVGVFSFLETKSLEWN